MSQPPAIDGARRPQTPLLPPAVPHAPPPALSTPQFARRAVVFLPAATSEAPTHAEESSIQ